MKHPVLLTLRALLLVAIPFLCSQPASAQNTAAKKGPNIILIVSDDQAWGDYGFMGHPFIQTPNLDRLARESVTYTRGYVPSSLCCPSLASIITGQYPHQHRVTSNDPPVPAGMTARQFQASPLFQQGRDKMNGFMDASPTLPKLLVEKGYLALQTGKWWQGNYKHGGFTHGMTLGSRHGDKGLEIGRQTLQPIFDFIQEATEKSKPFMVWYAPMMPHDPHTPPERLLEKYKQKTGSIHVARYWAMVEWFDETIGQILDHLDQKGISEDTLIAYVTDNGWIQSEDSPRYAPKSKQSPYDGGLRTPIMLRWKKHAPARMDTSHLASSLDLSPTILKACGIEVPKAMAGVDLLNTNQVSDRHAVHGECFTHNAVDLDKPEKSLRWRWMIEGDWKLIVPDPVNEPKETLELYHLKEDPSETRNVSMQNPSTVDRLRKQIDSRWDPSP